MKEYDDTPSTTTEQDRFERYDLIQLKKLEWKPKLCNFDNNIRWLTLSNAFEKSVYTVSTWARLLKASMQYSEKTAKLEVVDLPDMKPC